MKSDDMRPSVFATPLPFRLRLASLKSARQSVARIVRSYAKGEIDPATYKGVLYGLQNLLAFMKSEHDYQIERRLDEIEDEVGRARQERRN